MVGYTDSCFLQMFLGERFSTLASKSMEFSKEVKEEAVFPDGLKRMRPSNTYNPQAWRWLNTKKASNKLLEKVIDKRKCFASSLPRGITNP